MIWTGKKCEAQKGVSQGGRRQAQRGLGAPSSVPLCAYRPVVLSVRGNTAAESRGLQYRQTPGTCLSPYRRNAGQLQATVGAAGMQRCDFHGSKVGAYHRRRRRRRRRRCDGPAAAACPLLGCIAFSHLFWRHCRWPLLRPADATDVPACRASAQAQDSPLAPPDGAAPAAEQVGRLLGMHCGCCGLGVL